jgi:exodeoxyribonuclease-5
VEHTEQQSHAISLACDSLINKKDLVRIGGYAGTGKTTLLKEVYNTVPNGAIAAFAGKACDVLRKKGLPGQTIHSLIYKFDSKTNRFYLVDNLKDIDWVGIDEGSMVGSALWSDLKSFKMPTLVIGDPGQLEPVADDDPHLMVNPDYTLTEIHRQALNNPIIKLSLRIRENELDDWGRFGHSLKDINCGEDLLWPDMLVCGFNKTRLSINSAIRKLKKFDKHLLNEGERIVCKNNDAELGVFNGQMFTVSCISNDGKCYNLVSDCGREYALNVAKEGFNQYSRLPWSKVRPHLGKRMIADYGNVITCHGSQGSEWGKVSYVDEQCDKWCPVRHRYTGCTRASQELRVYSEGVY